jgi:acyl transferase domain-containing protein
MSAVKLALLAQQVRDRIEGADVLAAEPIAIIGVACRFPGDADTPERFWELLRSGGDAIGEVPADRWDVDAYYDPDSTSPGKMSTRWGGFVGDIDEFDAGYFGISPREASRMDPQQRLVLEVAVEALERAGQPRDRIAGTSTGVFMASTMNDYADRQFDVVADIDAYSITGNIHCIIANRVSFLLDLHGPSVAVDTACSSSLVAVHAACQSLRTRDSDMALAGGVNVVLTPEPGVAMSKWGVMAADGRCKAFDASADGFVRGEGCGVVVLKRLADALADDDPIAAVVRGSAVNQDGRSTAMSAPNGLAQQDVIRRALRAGRVLPEQIGFVESHGTGTELGDPIEVEALAEVLASADPAAPPVALGAVKTNIGHLEAAAGMAGLIKLVLCLQHEEIPPNLHLTTLNPHISFEGTRLFVPTGSQPWPSGATPRLGGVSSFGFGGTNAHIVVEEAPRLPPPEAAPGPYVLTASATSADALRAAATRLAALLDGDGDDRDDLDLGDVCATAALRRTHHDERLAVVGATRADLVERLRAHAAGERQAGLVGGQRRPGERRRVAFVFSGQGTQWWAMGRELLAASSVFRDVVEECDALLRPYVSWSLLDELAASEEESRLDQTAYAQPALFAVQVGLAAVWRSWGVVPDAVAGHSVGEVAAAHVSGALDLEDAIRVIAHRGRFMQEATGNGTMASVALPLDDVEAHIAAYGEQISIAAVNAPTATVISGETAAMAEVVASLRAAGVDVQPLPVNYAFHSHQMERHAGDLGVALAGLEPRPSRLRFVSTVTGEVVDGPDLGADYWASNVRRPVRFSTAVGTLAAAGCSVFVEVGPNPVLGGAIAGTLGDAAPDDPEPVITPTLRRGRPDLETMLATLGQLHCCGVEVDWAAVMPGRHRVASLPTYPWQRRRHWVEARPVAAGHHLAVGAGGAGGEHPLVGSRIRSAAIAGFLFESHLGSEAPSFLGDHRIGDIAVVPATAFLELAAEAYAAATSRRATVLADVELLGALALPGDGSTTVVQVHLEHVPHDEAVEGAEVLRFTVSSSPPGHDDVWTVHASGRVAGAPHDATPDDAAPEDTNVDLDAARAVCTESLAAAALYEGMAERSVRFGDSFRAVADVRFGAGEAVGEMAVPDAVAAEWSRYVFHPALLDAALHPLTALLPTEATYLPIALAEVRLHGAPQARMTAHARLRNGEAPLADVPLADVPIADVPIADVTVYGEDGWPLAELIGLRLVRTDPAAVAALARGAAARGDGDDDHLYELSWQPATGPAAVPAAGGPWLVVADRGGVGAALAALLADAGAPCVVVAPDVQLDRPTAAELLRTSGATEIVYLRGLDVAPLEDGAVDVLADQERALGGALALVQAEPVSAARLALVTRGAQAVHGPPTAPEQAPLSGLGATIPAEVPDLPCIRVDLDPAHTAHDAASSLVAALSAAGDEELLAVRGDERSAARLVPLPIAERRPTGEAVRLASTERGVLDGLHLEQFERRSPGEGEIEIRVAVTGLNFRDVLIALDLYPEHVPTFGDECSGEVVRVGPGVEHVRPGDRVVSMGSGAFASHLTTDADLAIRIPDDLGFEDAATIPIPFLTAEYALARLAGIGADDRVLIHAGAGGVGMAAVQLAQRAGAEVIATAGSSEKRAVLEGLGVRHVFDSRSLDFADGVLGATGGRGVDVVLNSLSGDFIPRSLDVLAPEGRFLEIGKRDIWTAEQVAEVRPDVAYHVVFLGDLSIGDPPAIQAMLGDLLPRFAAGELHPLPRTTYDVVDVVDAFRFMAQARHIGKIVVRQPDAPGTGLAGDGTILVTGGLGGIGLEVARDLAGRGARHLALVGRRPLDELGDDVAAAIAGIEAIGAGVATFRGDVACRDDVVRILAEIDATMPALRGVVHAAGVNDDAVLGELSWERFERALAPKMAGAWHLHQLTGDRPLDLFVLFSSAAAVLGGPGQGNYAAANAFLDSFGSYRRARSGTGLSVGWGPWDHVGMTARLEARDVARMQRRGVRPLAVSEALAALERLLAAPPAEQPGYAAAIALDPATLEQRPLLAALRRPAPAASPAGSAAAVSLFDQWVDTVVGMRRATISTFVSEQARKVLGLPASSVIPPRQPFNEIGLDSLMAVELRNAVGAALGRPQPATLLFDHPTADSLVEHLLAMVTAASDAAPAATATDADVDHLADLTDVADLADLTDEEAEALLLAELGGGGEASA